MQYVCPRATSASPHTSELAQDRRRQRFAFFAVQIGKDQSHITQCCRLKAPLVRYRGARWSGAATYCTAEAWRRFPVTARPKYLARPSRGSTPQLNFAMLPYGPNPAALPQGDLTRNGRFVRAAGTTSGAIARMPAKHGDPSPNPVQGISSIVLFK